ncbi:MAG TPA: hypothetical protein VKS20_15185 [Candidatus Acidoferrales bacterium]|nr:hypothetical protein [Candidatus Acidoferrales bacterium]
MFQQMTSVWRLIGSRVRGANWWRGSYTRALEEEVERLRAQNRALVNSILGVAGIPPMRVAPHSAVVKARRGSPGRPKDRPCAGKSEAANRNTGPVSEFAAADGEPKASRQPDTNRPAGRELQPAAALRRRSWQQIGRALEIEDLRAAQRERESDADTFPAPRNVVPRA